jgi:lipoate-protein ligase B
VDAESNKAGKTWLCADFPLMGYQEAWDLQVDLVAARKSRLVPEDVLLLMEHPPVFTMGRRGGRENLLVSEVFLQESGIPILHVERGGDITFHGPGQLVGYPIVDLHAGQWGVAGYVERLEEVMIRTAAHWGVCATRNPLNHGIWVGNSKLGSIGIAVRCGIAFHGFAFNVNVSLEPFGWINPCGLQGIGMTSLKHELSQTLSMSRVREQLRHNFEAVFEMKLALTDPASLRCILMRPPEKKEYIHHEIT